MKNIGVGTRLSIAFALVATVAMCSGIFDMMKINQINEGFAKERQIYQMLLQLHETDPASQPGQREKLLSAGEEQKAATERMVQSGFKFGILFIICTFIFAHGTGLVIKFSITRPLNKVVKTLKKGESGDMRARSEVKQENEIGIVASATDNFFEKIQAILRGIHLNSETLAGASEELSAVSKQLASSAEETSVNANDVAGAAERMSLNMSSIATAVEEMSASISQIASSTGEVNIIVVEATDKARDATSVMGKLGVAAKEIGHVTDIIKKIADKTNLLALNATIEASSAGEAGKSFTVVANAIKELANQSAKNADDITHRIESIQSGTNDAVEVIHNVAEIIDKINHSVEAIAGHANQQTKASNEIVSNVAQANTGAKHVAGAIGEVAKGTNGVSRNAGEVASKRAGDLAKIAAELRETVSMFTV